MADGEPSVWPSRATVAGIVVDGAVSSTAAEPDPGTVDPAPADEPGAGLPRFPVPAPFEVDGRKLSAAMTTIAIAMAARVIRTVGDRQAGARAGPRAASARSRRSASRR